MCVRPFVHPTVPLHIKVLLKVVFNEVDSSSINLKLSTHNSYDLICLINVNAKITILTPVSWSTKLRKWQCEWGHPCTIDTFLLWTYQIIILHVKMPTLDWLTRARQLTVSHGGAGDNFLNVTLSYRPIKNRRFKEQ